MLIVATVVISHCTAHKYIHTTILLLSQNHNIASLAPTYQNTASYMTANCRFHGIGRLCAVSISNGYTVWQVYIKAILRFLKKINTIKNSSLQLNMYLPSAYMSTTALSEFLIRLPSIFGIYKWLHISRHLTNNFTGR